MATPPIVLIPGFWLGAWAWDEVAAALRAGGYEVTALTLPGLESRDTDRSAVTLSDHVDAICEAVEAAGSPVVLVAHSGAGVSGYAASDRAPEKIAAMVYVDSGPGIAALNPEYSDVEQPLPPWEDLASDGNSLEGLSEEQLERFRQRAIPEPGAALREAPSLTNDARRDIPTTVICSSLPSEQIKAAVEQGLPWLAGLAELRNVTYVDLPTGHWPMWSRPDDLAEIIAGVADAHASGS